MLQRPNFCYYIFPDIPSFDRTLRNFQPFNSTVSSNVTDTCHDNVQVTDPTLDT